MKRKYGIAKRVTLVLLFFSIAQVRPQNTNGRGNDEDDHHKGCAYMQCENDDVCVHRKYRCKTPPCPSMLFCAKSRAESIRGPLTCDTVRCRRGYVCVVKVHGCRWDEKCRQQIAKCISRKDYYEGPASCAGFKCPPGNHCVLRESLCGNPPCKLLESCARNKDVQIWFGRCRSLGCPSEYECFLRRPENPCLNPPCTHTPDCITTTEEEITNQHCRGWICPRRQSCSAQIVGSCETDSCDVKRSCDEPETVLRNTSSSLPRRSLNDDDESIKSSQINKTSLNPNGEISNEEKHSDKWKASWMNHLKSKTELDAIELWIKNAEKQADFKHFHDWLRSVRDALGSIAYDLWINEIHDSGSRSQKFREWLRESKIRELLEEKKDKYDSIIDDVTPRMTEELNNFSTDLTNNLTKTHFKHVPSFSSNSEDEGNMANENRRRGDESFISKEDFVNMIEKLLTPHTVLLPPYSALEYALPDHLRKSNNSPDFSNDPKYPIYNGVQISSPHLPETRNTYRKPHYLIPDGNGKESSRDNSRFNFQNNDSQNYKNDDPKGRTVSNRYNFQSGNEFNGNKSIDKTQTGYFDNVSPDFLEDLVKSIELHSTEKGEQGFQENLNDERENHHDNSRTFLRSGQPIQDYDWNPVDYVRDYLFTTENSRETAHGNTYKHFDEAGETHVIDRANKSNETDLRSFALKDDKEDNSDVIDLKSFIELNKDSLLPYIKSLIDAMNQDYDFANDTELNSDGSAVKKSFVNYNDTDDASELSDKLALSGKTVKDTPGETHFSSNSKAFTNFSWAEKIENVQQTRAEILRKEKVYENQEKVSRTPLLIYGDDQPGVRSYNISSYGASDKVDGNQYDNPNNYTARDDN